MSSKYKIRTQEIDRLLEKGNEDRFEYFVHKVSDWGEVWSLKTDTGWVLLGDEVDGQVAPFWPFQEFAERCAIAEWVDASPGLIDLEAFTKKWLPGLMRDGRRVAVFPNEMGDALVVNPFDLLEKINEERDAIFGE